MRARSARGCAAAGLVVVSGMALGIDAAAHDGALDATGTTIAVLACGPDHAYPRAKRALHAQIAARGLVAVGAAAGQHAVPLGVPGTQPDHRRAQRR